MRHLLLLDRSGEDFRKEVSAWRVGMGVRDKDSRRGAMVVMVLIQPPQAFSLFQVRGRPG